MLLDRRRSFRHAFRGLGRMILTQRNAWIHAAATVLALGMSIALRISAVEWALILLSVGSVWTAEAMNTAIESLADAVTPDYHPRVREAKDIAAAAVLITAVVASVVGLLIFVPRLIF